MTGREESVIRPGHPLAVALAGGGDRLNTTTSDGLTDSHVRTDVESALVAEGHELFDRAQLGDRGERGQTAVMAGDLVDRARRALDDGAVEPATFARLLRAAAVVRNLARLPELPPDPLVHDLITHTVAHELVAHNAMAQALRGTLAVSRGAVDEALDAAVDAMATLEVVDRRSVEHALASDDVAALLDHLGLPDHAADLYAAAASEYAELGMLSYQVMTMGDQALALVGHGLWLERVGRGPQAVARFGEAASVAETALDLWTAQGEAEPLDDDVLSAFAAAAYLARPSAGHEHALRDVTERFVLPAQVVAVIALARLLAADGRTDEAIAVVDTARVAARGFHLSLPLRLALAKGLPTTDGSYTDHLERELWTSREARAQSLRMRLEHERLRRHESPLRASTGLDPVTRLPDRGVVDDAIAACDAPSALAVVDVDELMAVNQRDSYAHGDAVLRAVAVTVRAAARPGDTVARLTEDELVVVMPGASLDEATALMRVAAAAVAALPAERGHGATVSVGVVPLSPGEAAESVLVRADEATERAKEHGGDQVVALPTTPAPR